MDRITFLQSFNGLFPQSNEPPSRFSQVEKWLGKNLGFKKVALLIRHGKSFNTFVPPAQVILTQTAPSFRLLTGSRKPWIAPKGARKSPWAAFWPILSGDECIACLAMGDGVSPRRWTQEERQILDLISERIALWLEQKCLWDELESANRQATLGWLLGAVVHEIRNPLSSLNTFLQLMPGKQEDPHFLESFQKVASREIGRLIDLTRDLLDFLKTSPETMKKVELTPLIGHVVDLVEPLFKSKKVSLQVRVLKSLSLMGNEGQIECLVLNLLQNAFNAVDPGGKVELSCEWGKAGSQGAPFVLLHVKDNGKGISKEELPMIFKSFYSTESAGHGLGLPICQKIVSNHGGRIKVKSAPRKGILFTVELPGLLP